MPDLNDALDAVIRARRTCRAFRPEAPDRELVAQVLDAGMHAPYAALAVAGRPDFRRFFVIPGSGSAMGRLREIAAAYEQRTIAWLDQESAAKPALASQLAKMRARLEGGILPECPWLVLVAELTGFPPVAPQSLAHCIENMWLKATALGLGLRLLSAFERLSDDADLCALLGLTPGQYALNGCALGFPAHALGPSERPDTAAATTWLG